MKKIAGMWLFAGFVVLLNIGSVFAKDNPMELSLPFEKAVIYYDITGSQKGTETLYIRDFGNERVKITKSEGKVMFISTSTDIIEITTRDSVVNIDVEEKTGTKVTNPQKIMQEEMEKLSAEEREIAMKNLETIGMNMATQMGGQVKPKAGEHLGFTCDLMTAMGSTSCLISGTSIILKMESNLLGITMNTVAKKIDKNASVPADVFRIPEDVAIKFDKEADELSRTMIASMIQSMKDPAAAEKFEEGMDQKQMNMEDEQQLEAQETEEVLEIDISEDLGEENDESEDKQTEEMMEKGMNLFKGLFN